MKPKHFQPLNYLPSICQQVQSKTVQNLHLDIKMAPTLYLNDTDLRTYLLRNGPSPWLCKFTLCFFFLQCSCSYALLWVYCYPHWRSYFSCQLLDGFTETRMTFHWKFQQLRVKIPRFLHEKISNFIIQVFFLFCVHSITRLKNLDYKIVLGEYILQFFLSTFLGGYILFQNVLT